MKKIVIIGTTFMDIKGYPIGEYSHKTRNAGRVEYFHGGVGRNIAEDVANVAADFENLTAAEKLSTGTVLTDTEKMSIEAVPADINAEVVFVSLVDDSVLSQAIIDRLKKSGVNTSYMKKVPHGLGTWIAIFDENGDMNASISARAGMSQIKDILDESGDEIFKDADGVLVEVDMDEDIIKRIAELAEKYDTDLYTGISNMSIALERKDIIKRTRFFVCNRIEAAQMFGEKVEDADKLAEKIKKWQIDSMVVTLDTEGCIYADKISGERGRVDAEKIEVVDTTGAGDSFFAGVSYGLISGLGIKRACEIAVHIAATVVSSKDNVYQR